MIRFRCHKCTRKIAIPDGAAGKVLKCPSCQSMNQAPNPYDPDTDFEIRSEEIRITKLERLEVHKASGRVSKSDYAQIKKKLTEMDFGLPVTEETLKQQAEEKKAQAEARRERRGRRGDSDASRDEEGVDIYDDTTQVYNEEANSIYDDGDAELEDQYDDDYEEYDDDYDEYEEEYDDYESEDPDLESQSAESVDAEDVVEEDEEDDDDDDPLAALQGAL